MAVVPLSAVPLPSGHTPYSWGASSSSSPPYDAHRMMGHTVFSWQGDRKQMQDPKLPLSLRATAKAFVPRGGGGGGGGGGGRTPQPALPSKAPPAVPRATIKKSSTQDWRVAEKEERERREQQRQTREEEARAIAAAAAAAAQEEEEKAFPSLTSSTTRTPATAAPPSQSPAPSYAARLLEAKRRDRLVSPQPPLPPPPPPLPSSQVEQPFRLVTLDPSLALLPPAPLSNQQESPPPPPTPIDEVPPQDSTSTTQDEAPSSSSSSCFDPHPTLAAHALASKRFARRMKGKVQEEYTRRAQAARREALESRLMCLEDHRARAIRRMEGGGGVKEEEEEEEEEEEVPVAAAASTPVPPPSSSSVAGENGAGGGGWFTFLRPSSTVRGGLLVEERQEEGGEGDTATAHSNAARRRRHTKEEEFLLLLHLISDAGSTWQSLWNLIEKEGLDWDARDPTTRQNALHVAAAQGRVELLEALLRRVPSLTSALESVDRRRMTPLLHAAAGKGPGAGECLKLLLKKGANAEGKDRASETALHKAARAGNVGVVTMLMANGGGVGGKKKGGRLRAVGVRNKRRETPLHLAAEAGWEEVVVVLLGHGADLWATDCDGHTPLSLASANGHVSVVTLLLLRAGGSSSVLATEEGRGRRGEEEGGGTEPQPQQQQPQEKRRSPLIEAAGRGEDGVVALLLTEGWNPRLALEWRGRTETPLLRAIEAGHVSTVQLLIKAGAAWSLGKMEEALVFAAKCGETAVLRWLMAEAGLVGGGKEEKKEEEKEGVEPAQEKATAVDSGADKEKEEEENANVPGATATKRAFTTTTLKPLTASAKEALLPSLVEAAVVGGDTDTIVEVMLAGGKVELDKFLEGGGMTTFLGKWAGRMRFASSCFSKFGLVFTPTLRNDLETLLSLPEEAEMHDVVFLVDGRRFPAHRAILAARCEKFEAMFRCGGFAEGEVGRGKTAKEVSLEGQWRGDTFASFLKYVYTGQGPESPFGEEGEGAIAELLLLADECLCFGLRRDCEHLLGEYMLWEAGKTTGLACLGRALGLVSALDLQILKAYCYRMPREVPKFPSWCGQAQQLLLDVLGPAPTPKEEEDAWNLVNESPLMADKGEAGGWVEEICNSDQHVDQDPVLLSALGNKLRRQRVTWGSLDKVFTGTPRHISSVQDPNHGWTKRHMELTAKEDGLIRWLWQHWWRQQPKGTAQAPSGEALRLDLARLVGDGGLLPDCFVACGGGDDDELLGGGGGGGRETYPAHRALLMQRSARMAAHFRFLDTPRNGSKSGSDGGLPTYTFPSLSSRTLRPLLSFLYTDRLHSAWSSDFSPTPGGGGWDTETLMELAVTADEFLLPNLLALCEWELCQEEHLQGEGERGLEKTTQLFFLAEVVPAMSKLRAQAALVLVRRFHELPVEEEEGGIGRKALCKAALDCLMEVQC